MKLRAILSLLDRRIIPLLVVVIFFLSAGTTKANSMIYYTQSYSPFQMISADLTTPATPKVIYTSGSGSPYAVAVDGTNRRIYFSDPNPTVAKIFYAPLDGNAGDYTPFISNVSAEGIAVDPTHGYIFYAQPGSGNVVRANLTDGSGPQTIYTSAGAPRAVAVDPVGGKIYIADYNLAKIIRSDLDGSNPEDLITNVHAKGLGLDTTHGKIYYTDAYNPKFDLVRANLTDGSGSEILYSSSTGSPGAVAVDPVNGYIYFSDWHSTVAKIYKADLDGLNQEVLLNNVNSYGIGLYIAPSIFTLSGTISDFQGVLQGATVDAGNGNTTTTDASGNFSLNLPNGTYTLTVTKNEYQSSTMSVTVNGGNLTGQNLTLSKVTTVTSISPSCGPESGGTIVSISGTGFTGATAVNFGTAVGTNLTVNSDTSITVTSPAGTGTIDVTVTTPGGTNVANSSDQFTYTGTSLVSITTPSAITGVANGTAKTAGALGLPLSVVMVTNNGNVDADVTWDVVASIYDEITTTEQTFNVNGTVSLPAGVVNPNSVALTTTIIITVEAAASVDKTLVSITTPSAITGVANGTAKTAGDLGLPSSVVMVTDNGNVNANVSWDVNASSYNVGTTTEQTFTVNGTVGLPAGVVNSNSVALTTTISVTVNAATSVDKTLISITTPSAITGVANGTAKTAAALGLPITVVLATDNGNVNANVTWDVDASSYNVGTTMRQIFTVNGTVTLPAGVVNPNSLTLSTTISVTVDAAASTDDGSDGPSRDSSEGPTHTTVTGDVIDGKTGLSVKGIEAQVTTETNGTKTVEVKSKEAILFRQPDGEQSSVSDLSKLGFSAITNADSKITLTPDGTIQIKNLGNGTDSIFTVTYDLGNGQKIAIGTIEVKVGSNGKVSFTCTLIDPYGIITDPTTGQAIVGADVTLYYANTERNKSTGKTPDTIVQLPVLDGFKPNNNKNPQVSDASGAYGFMVFPTSDYYIVAKNEGYEAYKSPTISVEQDIVKWDFKMNQTITGVKRLAGLTSVDTALEIAKGNYTTKLTNVVLATAENYPDALAGSVLAYKLNAPILLVGNTEVDQEKILAYLKSNLNATGTVYILGGTAVVSAEMEVKVMASGFNQITRLGGTDRYETAVKIADQLEVKSGTPIVLVYGENYPDALAISSSAAGMQSPILLVQKEGLSDMVQQKIAEIKPTKVYIIGGEGVISTAVESQVAQIASLDKTNMVRISGADRYETSLAIAQYFNLSGQSVCIATGNNFPDALAGSVYAANLNAPIILADGNLSDQAINFLKARAMTGATLFGGEAVVSKDIEQQLGQLIEK